MSEAAVMATEKQAVPKGYKQTEVGVIPEDWEVSTISECMTLINGYGFKPHEWKSEGLPIIRIQNLNDKNAPFNYFNGPLDKKYHVKKGDILFAWSGSKGISFGARVWERENAILNQHIFKVIPSTGHITDKYCYRVLRSVQENIEKKAHGFKSSFVHIQKGDLESTLLPLPTKEEQTAIANALSDMDALMTELEQLIAKKQAIKTATMQQLLTGKTRLPQFANHTDGEHKGQLKGMKPSELGEIPEDWEVVALGNVCSFENGDRSSNYPAAHELLDFGIPFINAGHVSDGHISFEKMDFISTKVFERLGGGKVRAGDILYCLRGSLGKFGVVSDNFGLGAIASSLVIIRPNIYKTTTAFISIYFKSELAKNMILLWAGGAAQPNLGAKELAKFFVPLPNKEEQTAIANILSDMDAEIQALELRFARTHQIKQGMMQELLTGKTRLPVEADD